MSSWKVLPLDDPEAPEFKWCVGWVTSSYNFVEYCICWDEDDAYVIRDMLTAADEKKRLGLEVYAEAVSKQD